MSFLLQTCGTTHGNSGAQSCTGTPGRDEKIWLVPEGTTIASKALAETEATWDTLFNAAKGTRGVPLPRIFNATFEPGEDVYETGWANKQDFVSEGLDKVTYTLEKTATYVSGQLRTLNGIKWEAFICTASGKIKGWSDDATTFKPFSMLSFRVGKRTPETGEATERTPITIVWADPNEWNNYPAVIEPTWNAADLDGIKDLYVTASSPTTSGVTLTIIGFDSVPHEGAVAGDFVIYNSSLVAQTISGISETSGVYVVSATLAPGTYTGGLKHAEDATTKYFETPTLASFTVT